MFIKHKSSRKPFDFRKNCDTLLGSVFGALPFRNLVLRFCA